MKKDVAFFLKHGGEGAIGTVPEGGSWVFFSTARKKELRDLYLEEGSRKGDAGPVPGERRQEEKSKVVA